MGLFESKGWVPPFFSFTNGAYARCLSIYYIYLDTSGFTDRFDELNRLGVHVLDR